MDKEKKKLFIAGLRDGVPIGLGYLAASFGLGIAARNAGLTPLQSALASVLNSASAGEYAGFMTIAAGETFFATALMTLIANARYLLMSIVWSQRMAPDLPFRHRFCMGFYLTDELFSIAIARPGYLEPVYSYGAICVAVPMWTVGTALGCVAGNILPPRALSAFSVALFGMFLACITPEGRKNRVTGVFILISFFVSWLGTKLPLLASMNEGTRTILLTLAVSAAAALLFPIADEEGEEEAAEK